MALSAVDIASQALGLLRADSINSFDEGTNEADIAKLFYDNFAKDILTRYPWSFATKKRLLVRDSTDPVNEFRYSHVVPSEALRVWALFDTDAVGARPITDYDIQSPSGGRRIFSNFDVLYADYTVYTDEANWPGYFVTFAFKAFAALIAKAVTDQDDLSERLRIAAWGSSNEGEQGGAFASAMRMDSQQKPGETIFNSPLIDARFFG